MSDNTGDTFRVAFRGASVDCPCLNDAVALLNAENILSNPSLCEQSPAQLDRIAEVLESYGQTDAASVIANLASRGRAIQFLIGSVGYERPKHPMGT